MLKTLTWYELKKLLGGNFFLIALCLLLAAAALLNCGLPAYLSQNNDIPPEEAPLRPGFWESAASARRLTGYLRAQYAIFETASPEELSAFETAMTDKYGKDVFAVPIPTEEMMSVPGYWGDMSDLTAILNFQALSRANEEAGKALDKTLRGAEAFGQEALDKGDTYGVRRNRNITRLYSVPRAPITAPVRGWDSFLFENHTMLLVFLLLYLVCAGSVSREENLGTWLLLHTAKNGKGKALAAKYLAGAISAVGFTLFFQFVSLGAVWFQSGLLGVMQPVTALEQLRLIPYGFTVGQYVLLTLGCRIFAAVLLSVLLTTLSALCRSGLIAYPVGGIFLGGLLVPVYLPQRAEWLSGPLALSAPLKYFRSYYTANLLGFPVLWVVVQVGLWCVLGVGCMVLAHRVYRRKRGAI